MQKSNSWQWVTRNFKRSIVYTPKSWTLDFQTIMQSCYGLEIPHAAKSAQPCKLNKSQWITKYSSTRSTFFVMMGVQIINRAITSVPWSEKLLAPYAGCISKLMGRRQHHEECCNLKTNPTETLEKTSHLDGIGPKVNGIEGVDDTLSNGAFPGSRQLVTNQSKLCLQFMLEELSD